MCRIQDTQPGSIAIRHDLVSGFLGTATMASVLHLSASGGYL